MKIIHPNPAHRNSRKTLAAMQNPVKLTTLDRFKLTTPDRLKLTIADRSKLTT
jgi:hypothetical protein